MFRREICEHAAANREQEKESTPRKSHMALSTPTPSPHPPRVLQFQIMSSCLNEVKSFPQQYRVRIRHLKKIQSRCAGIVWFLILSKYNFFCCSSAIFAAGYFKRKSAWLNHILLLQMVLVVRSEVFRFLPYVLPLLTFSCSFLTDQVVFTASQMIKISWFNTYCRIKSRSQFYRH